MPPYIRKVRVDLILGTPFQEDGPPTDAKGWANYKQVTRAFEGLLIGDMMDYMISMIILYKELCKTCKVYKVI